MTPIAKQTPCYYDVLEISPQASDVAIKKAYHQMALRFHPDRNPRNRRLAELKFRLIHEAYNNLKTAERRATYNHRKMELELQQSQNDNNDAPSSWLSRILGIRRNAQ
jgi:DnaJ-class molecular chaperone